MVGSCPGPHRRLHTAMHRRGATGEVRRGVQQVGRGGRAWALHREQPKEIAEIPSRGAVLEAAGIAKAQLTLGLCAE